MKRYIFVLFTFNAVTTFGFVVWWNSLASQPLIYEPPVTTLRRRMPPPIAETGEERQCVEEFLSNYERTCSKTMHPNPDNIIVDATRNALLAAAENATDGEWWTTEVADRLLCPCVPSDLVGFVDVTRHLDNTTDNYDYGNYSLVDESKPSDGISLTGGRWMPDWCIARQRIAILIAYKDREYHLRLFLRQLRPLLQRQLLDYTIFIIEQLQPEQFNKGSLFNAGFIEVSKRGNFDCYIFHDVDTLPLDDRNFYTCQSMPRHVGVYLKNREYRIHYDCIFGGAQAFTAEQYRAVNGYPVTFFGWGGEDDDFLRRVWAANLTVSERYPMCVSRYTALRHYNENGRQLGKNQRYGLRWRPELYRIDGLNSVQYGIVSYDERQLYTHLAVIVKPAKNISRSTFDRISKSAKYISPAKCRIHSRVASLALAKIG